MAEVITFGCRLNSAESEGIKNAANQADLGEDYVILNSCAVTNEAERDVMQTIRKLKKTNSNCKIILTGCAAQINPNKYAELAEVSHVIGNSEKENPDIYRKIINNEEISPIKRDIDHVAPVHAKHEDRVFYEKREISEVKIENFSKISVSDIMSETAITKTKLVTNFEGKSRAFLEIQNGCNHRCTFCIIPYGRGNSRSVPYDIIRTAVVEILQNGYKEIVFTGVDITDYGMDLPDKISLGRMIKTLLRDVRGEYRIRLSSIDVAEIDEDLMDLIRHEPQFMPYFHLSLQSGDNLILKRMKRRHSREDILKFCDFAKSARENVGIGADIIAGFPTETDVQFKNSIDIIEQCGIAFGHIFSFSPKNGTPAAQMPQVDAKTIKERNKLLAQSAATQKQKLINNMLGSTQHILLESNANVRCENFVTGKLLNVDSTQHLAQGQIYRSILKHIDEKFVPFFEII